MASITGKKKRLVHPFGVMGELTLITGCEVDHHQLLALVTARIRANDHVAHAPPTVERLHTLSTARQLTPLPLPDLRNMEVRHAGTIVQAGDAPIVDPYGHALETKGEDPFRELTMCTCCFGHAG